MRTGTTRFLTALATVMAVSFTAIPSASAALARPPVAQRDVLDRFAAEVSANGRYALTRSGLNSTTFKRIDLVTKAIAPMNFEALNPHLVADGTSVVFESTQQLVAADTNGVLDLYRYVFATKAFARIALTNRPANWELSLRDINADGKVIAFFGSNGVLGKSGILIFDVVAKVWRRPDTKIPTSASANRQSGEVSLSASGRLAAVTSYPLVGATTNVWLYNWTSNTVSLVSVRANGTVPTSGCNSGTPDISADGTWISFRSDCANIVAGLSAVKPRVFVRNRLTKVTKFITDKETNDFVPDLATVGAYHGPQLGVNGTMLVLLENRPTKIGGATFNATQPVLYRLSTRENVMLDKPAGTAIPNGFSRSVFVSSAGKSAIFTTQATNFTTVTSPSTVNIDRVFWSALP